MPGSPSNPFDLTGRVVLVTGGASGIGAGITNVLAEACATVVIVDNDDVGASRQSAALASAGHKGGYVTIDLAQEDSIVRGCAEAISTYGGPWALINNAGLQDRELLLDGTVEMWDRTFSVNARAPFLMIREIARAMVEGKNGGRIINIASAALIGNISVGHSAYAASKAALLGLARANALELSEYGITVNTILPGGVMTPGGMAAKGPEPAGPARRRPPFGFSEPRDIGTAALFFASPAAKMITNQVLAVDGGWNTT